MPTGRHGQGPSRGGQGKRRRGAQGGVGAEPKGVSEGSPRGCVRGAQGGALCPCAPLPLLFYSGPLQKDAQIFADNVRMEMAKARMAALIAWHPSSHGGVNAVARLCCLIVFDATAQAHACQPPLISQASSKAPVPIYHIESSACNCNHDCTVPVHCRCPMHGHRHPWLQTSGWEDEPNPNPNLQTLTLTLTLIRKP